MKARLAIPRRIDMPGNIQYAIKVLLLLLALNTVLRFAFLMYNWDQAAAMSWENTLQAFWMGLRFDLVTIFTFNSVLFFFLILPLRLHEKRATYTVCNILVLIFNLPVFLMNGIDIIYFGFSDKRLTHELFTTQSDMGSFNFKVLGEFWWLILAFLLIVGAVWLLLRRFARLSLRKFEEDGHAPVQKKWLIALVGAGVIVLGARGGLQKSLQPTEAFDNTGDFFSASVGMNSAYTVMSAIDWGNEQPVSLMPSGEALGITRELIKNDFDGPWHSARFPLMRYASFPGEERPYNVVFLVIESLNANAMGSITGDAESYTPCLDTLARYGRLYTRHYSNAVRSVEALPAIVNSSPEIFTRPTIQSHFEGFTTYGLGNMLSERGYHNSFFCGARNGTMGFDRYSELCEIPNYFGMNEYPWTDRDFDGIWGLPDGPVLQWMANLQDSFPEPFFSVFFSVSNHHPFSLPQEGAEDIKSMDVSPMTRTIVYSDRALGEYFRTVSQMDWFNRTVFVITGDHCFHEMSDPEKTGLANFHVPLLILAPELEPTVEGRLSNHLNIMPTMIELLQLDTWHASTGISLLDPYHEPFVVNNLMGVINYAEDSLCWSSTLNQPIDYHHLVDGDWKREDVLQLSPVDRYRMDRRLRAVYQTYQNLRISNRFLDPYTVKAHREKNLALTENP